MTPPPQVAYVLFAGTIDAAGLNRFYNGFAGASAKGFTTIKLALQSTGGFVNDGIALYNFFRHSSFDLEVYNTGGVASIAAIAFLGAAKRYASQHATFMFHRTHASPPLSEAPFLRSVADSLVLDNARTEAIVKSHLPTLPKKRWTQMTGAQLILTAAEAQQYGLINAIQDFQVPKGGQFFAI